ncbi:MAG: hypothetical protein ACI9GW_002243 [Halieaceae bacterium]|jgi:hypothetical protein
MQSKSHFWIILLLLGTPLVAGLTAYFLPIYTASRDSELTFTAMSEVDFKCSDTSSVQVENWGNDGYARFCTLDGKKHGDWQAWQDGYLNIEGGFLAGEEEGSWKIFGGEGALQRAVVYRAGEVVEEQ